MGDKINVLSLFDGMACGMLAMLGAGIEVENYYAYEIDKYAIKTAQHNFPQIKELGDVFEADFTQYKGIDFLVGGSPCVPADTKIKTDKGYKKIIDIKIGDKVLTHKNRYMPVTRLYKRRSNHLYHIKYNGNKTIDITGNHPVYVFRDGECKFIRTDELTTDDYVCININQKSSSLNYTNDILWLVGRALADGYLSENKNVVAISVGKNKIEEFEKHLSGIKYYVTHKERPAPEYFIQSKEVIELYSYFGNNKALNKFIPDEILNLPISELHTLWNGYISGDGYIRKDKPNTVMWCSSSEDLTLSLGLVTAKLFAKYPTISIRQGEYKELPSGMCYTNTSFNSQISITDRVNPNVKVYGDKLLIKIKEIIKEDINIDVYNIETAVDHSYTIDNCIVHNCTYWSIAQSPDKRETTASGLGWELFSQYVRALREAQPKYFIYENNKSMAKAIYNSISETFGFEPIMINSALVSAQNRQRYYWVGKRNLDGTYSKVDVKQPEDRGILLRDILDGADLTSNDKSYTLTASYNGAVAWNTIERSQRNMVVEPVLFNTPHGYNHGGISDNKSPTLTRSSWQENHKVIEPVGTTKDGKSYCLTQGYSNGSGEKIGNYAAHTLKKRCKSMVAEPVNVTADGKSQTIKSQYINSSISNFVKYKSTYGTSGVAEKVDTSIQVGALPRPNGKLSTSQAFRVYDIDGKSVTLKAGGGGAGGKTGLYAIPIEFDDQDIPIKAISLTDGKTYTVYHVKDKTIEIKGKTYPIKLADGYYIIRKLTVSECKRLQTVPEWFEFPVSDTQAYKMMGNGWSVEVIIHLINSIFKGEDYERDNNTNT